MKSVVFLLPGTDHRPYNINGETIRYGGAPSSGTDQSVILVAEHLANTGWDVTIVLEKTDFNKVNGVKYTNFTYEGLKDKKINILISTLWFGETAKPYEFPYHYEDLPFLVTEALIYWQHMAWLYSTEHIKNFLSNNPQLAFGLVSPSAWALSQAGTDTFGNLLTLKTVIANPLMTDVIKNIEKNEIPKRVPKSTIFPVQHSRGGLISKKIVDQLGWEKTHVFNYIDPNSGLDKKELFLKMYESEYFLYPAMYDDYSLLVKDTFGCGVLECMAMGVIVITYPVGGVIEHFKEGCVFLSYPPEIDIEKIDTGYSIHCCKDFQVEDQFKKTIEVLEANPNLKEILRTKAMDISRNRFSEERIGKEWEAFINELITKNSYDKNST